MDQVVAARGAESRARALARAKYQAALDEIVQHAAHELLVVAVEAPQHLGLEHHVVLADVSVHGFP